MEEDEEGREVILLVVIVKEDIEGQPDLCEETLSHYDDDMTFFSMWPAVTDANCIDSGEAIKLLWYMKNMNWRKRWRINVSLWKKNSMKWRKLMSENMKRMILMTNLKYDVWRCREEKIKWRNSMTNSDWNEEWGKQKEEWNMI